MDDSTLLPSADYTLCLDSLLRPESHDLYLHVSKPPKEGSKAYNILQALNQVSTNNNGHHREISELTNMGVKPHTSELDKQTSPVPSSPVQSLSMGLVGLGVASRTPSIRQPLTSHTQPHKSHLMKIRRKSHL